MQKEAMNESRGKMKTTFKRIDNGYKCKPSYLCSNGLLIEPGDRYLDAYNYYVNDRGFEYLKDAKNYCRKFEKPIDNNKSL